MNRAMCEPIPFSAFAEQKTREASTATIGTLTTALDRSGSATTRWIGNAWTRLHYEGDFGLVVESDTRTSVSLVFVQSRDGNTAGGDPSALGGGETDKHLLYEGLSRVAADAVIVGARTIHPAAFFSVWHGIRSSLLCGSPLAFRATQRRWSFRSEDTSISRRSCSMCPASRCS